MIVIKVIRRIMPRRCVLDKPIKRIAIADDEQNIRELIKSFLKNAGYDVQIFETGDDLYASFLVEVPDLIILDIAMPGTDGLMICTKIRETSSVPIIIVSARDSELDRITGITIGSDDYLVKPFSPIELVTRVKALFRRMDYMINDSSPDTSEVQLSFGDIVISHKTRQAEHVGISLSLSPTEYDLLAYLIKNSDRAVSRDELLENVWRFDEPVDTRATDDVVKRLRKKIILTNVRIAAVWGFGFKLELADDEKTK